ALQLAEERRVILHVLMHILPRRSDALEHRGTHGADGGISHEPEHQVDLVNADVDQRPAPGPFLADEPGGIPQDIDAGPAALAELRRATVVDAAEFTALHC